ncbi:hypothetical protein [Muricoccus radiodurans]|uniref:hypothetical protein n=1 Tax=Muricoccus radiodurans TaxID=2231721 RepID=UPI003CE8B128
MNPLRIFLVVGAVMIAGPFVYAQFLDTHQVFYRDALPAGGYGPWQPGGRGPGPADCAPLLERQREVTPEELRATREIVCRRV